MLSLSFRSVVASAIPEEGFFNRDHPGKAFTKSSIITRAQQVDPQLARALSSCDSGSVPVLRVGHQTRAPRQASPATLLSGCRRVVGRPDYREGTWLPASRSAEPFRARYPEGLPDCLSQLLIDYAAGTPLTAL